jgi:hypothetical protein
MRTLLVLLFVLLARGVHAHSGPIAPSVCTFDPVTVTAVGGATLTGASGGPADAFRLLYDAATSQTQLCPAQPLPPAERCGGPGPARALTGEATSGSLTIAPFVARMLASGDLLSRDVPVTLTIGAETVSASIALTTGLVSAGDELAEGVPLGAGGFTLVGTVTLGGIQRVIRLTCAPTPTPELDDFVVPTRTMTLAGRLRSDGVELRAAFRPGAEAGTPDFGTPARVRVSADGATIASAEFPTGLAPSGRRKLVGQAADGSSLVVTLGRRNARLALTLPSATMPAAAASIPIILTYEVGGLLSRGTRAFRARGGSLRTP